MGLWSKSARDCDSVDEKMKRAGVRVGGLIFAKYETRASSCARQLGWFTAESSFFDDEQGLSHFLSLSLSLFFSKVRNGAQV